MVGKYDNYDDESFDVIVIGFAHKLLNEQEGCQDVDSSQQCKS